MNARELKRLLARIGATFETHRGGSGHLTVRLGHRMHGLTRAELQRRLGWQRESVDRLFRFDHASRLDQVDAALRALGEELRVETRAV